MHLLQLQPVSQLLAMKTFNISKNKGLLTEHLKYNHNLIADVENFLLSDSQPLNNRI